MIPVGMDIILSEVNFDPDKVKVVQCIGAHNEEQWIEYPIKSTYDQVDKILVVEGAVKGRPNATADGHSTDKTLDVVRGMEDPDNKIELITKDGFWNDLEEQKQTFLDRIQRMQKENPDWDIWVFICDADEVMTLGGIERFRKAIEAKPFATEFLPTFVHFWRDFKHISTPCEQWNILHQRFFRYQNGMKYNSHPIASDAQGVDTCLDPRYQPFRFQIPNLYIYHYGNVKSEEFQKAKARFYKSELAKYGAADEAQEKLKTYVERLEKPDEILYLDGVHPEVMKDHPLYKVRDTGLAKWDKTNLLTKWNKNVFYSGVPLPLIFTWNYRRAQNLWPTNPLEV